MTDAAFFITDQDIQLKFCKESQAAFAKISL